MPARITSQSPRVFRAALAWSTKNSPSPQILLHFPHLKLFERVGIFLDRLKTTVSGFNLWQKQNPGDIDRYKQYTNRLGYNWEEGGVTSERLYISRIIFTASGALPEDAQETSSIYLDSPYPSASVIITMQRSGQHNQIYIRREARERDNICSIAYSEFYIRITSNMK